MKDIKKRKKAQLLHQPSSWVNLFYAVFFVVVIPLIYSKATIDPVLYPRFLAWAAGLIILMIYFMFHMSRSRLPKNLLRNNILIWLSIFILISGISLFVAINPVEGISDLLKWILVFLWIFLTTIFLYHQPTVIVLQSKAAIVNAILAGLIGFYQYFNFAFQNEDPNALYEVSGLMAHKNQFSIALFLLLPFIGYGVFKFRSYWKRAAWLALGFNMLFIAILQTRAVWIAMAISIFIFGVGWLWMARRNNQLVKMKRISGRLILILASIILLAGISSYIFSGESPAKRIASVFDARNTSNEWRIEMWQATLDLVRGHPVTGVGAGNWKIAIYPYYGKYQPSVYRHWRNPHNDYLQVAAEKGLPGLVIFLLFLFSIVYTGFRIMQRQQEWENRMLILMISAIFSGFLVISFFSFPFERINHLLFLGLMVGVLIAFKNQPVSIEQDSPGIKPGIIVIPSIAFLLFSLYFGYTTVQSEMDIAKAQELKDRNRPKEFAKYAARGYHPWVPFEPRYSFPVVNYKGLAVYMEKKNYQTALELFKQAYRQYPTNFAVINNVGSVYGQMGQYDSSILYYQKTLDIFTHYEQGLLNMAKAWYMKKNYRKAYYYVLCCDPKSKNEEIVRLRAELEKQLN
ncbi:MAG: O-antigen ligase family protein [Bacteroidetes bacterium]|nr:O-antigen ligase family protein [Bacteroidota bacterium]